MKSEPGSGCGCGCPSRSGAPAGTQTQEELSVQPGNPAKAPSDPAARPRWVTGFIDTPAGRVPVVSTRFSAPDVVGAWKARWSIRRMRYQVEPGLCFGNPARTRSGHANHKLSFDRLRREPGTQCPAPGADTRGINVWCAAGKAYSPGKSDRIRATDWNEWSRHADPPSTRLTGRLFAHQVRRNPGSTGVRAGPGRDSGIFDNGWKALRRCGQDLLLADRAILVPVEFGSVMKYWSTWRRSCCSGFLGPGSRNTWRC
jgi:acetyl-CoA decarbonylase/synthase complex subunit gamma